MSENHADPVPPEPSTAPAVPTKRKRRRLRRFLIGALVVAPILLIATVLLLPTILSLGPVRALAVKIAGPKIAPNGHVQIDSWNFSWLGGQRINGITLLDDQNAAVAHLNVETGASLLALARGNYDLGDTKVVGDFDLRINPETGGSNLQHILGVDPAPKPATQAEKKPDAAKPDDKKRDDPPPKPAEPITVPDIKGTVSVKMTGTVSSTDPRDKRIPFTKVEQADLALDLNDLERGVAIDGTVRATVDGNPARVAIKGTADAIENRVVVADLNKLSADLAIAVEQLDLSALNAVLAAQKIDGTTLAGVMKGKLVANLQPGGSGFVRAEDGLGIDGLVVVAPQLKGDTLTLKRVDLPLDVARDAAQQITIKTAGLKSELLTLDVSGNAPQQVFQNLIDQKAPGGAGQVVVKTDAPSYAAIATMLPHVVALPPDVNVTGGGLTNVLTIDLTPDAARATTALALSAAGTSKGKPIELKRTTLDASADVALPGGYADAAKAIRAFTIDLAAPFATVKGGGKLTAMRVDGDADLTRLYADAAQFVAIEGTDLKGKIKFGLTTSGDPTNAAEPLGVKLGFDATGLTLTQAGKSMLADDAINGDVHALYKATDVAHVVTFEKLDIKSATDLFTVSTAGEPMWLAVPKETAAEGVPARTVGGQGELRVRTAKVARFARMAATQPADPATELKNGVLDSVVRFRAEQGGSAYSIVSKTDLTKLDVGEILKNESLTLTSDGSLAADTSTLKTTFAVASSFLTLKGDADARFSDPADADRVLSTFEQARVVNATGNANLPKLYALSTAISPPAVTLDPVTNEPLPPMRIDGGDLAFKLAVARDDARNVTRVNLDVPNIDKLQISRGKNVWEPEGKVTLSLASELTTDLTKATAAEQVQRLVATLDANVPGVLTAKTTTPIDVTNLSAETPNARGVLAATARLAPLGRLMAAVSGGEPMMMDGDARFDQTIASAGNAITLVGGGRITELLPTGPEAKPLPDVLRTIELKNDFSADLKAMSATIKSLDVVAPQARDVFALSASGTIRELSTNNVFDGMKAKLAYDWAQLWPLLQPIADPTGESIGRIDPFVGKYEKTFTIGGRYPTARADGTPILFNEAVRSVAVNGDVQIDRMTLVDKGIDVADLSLPLSLTEGVATIAFADGRPPKPAGLNGGRLDLGGLAVNLAGEEPILVDVENKKVLEGATLNPVLSNALGKFFNPIFPNATKANAQIEVTLSARDLHLGPSLQTRNSGRAKVVLSLLNLEIANPLSDQLLGGVVNQVAKLSGDKGVDTANLTNLSGELRDATFTLDRGVVRQDVTFMLGNESVAGATAQPKRYAFGFNGDVRLSDLNMSLNASFPLALLKDKLRGDVGDFLRFAPDQFPVSLTGSTSAPKLDQSALLRAVSESFVKAQVARSLAGGDKKGDAPDGKKSDGDKLADVLGGILGGKSAGEIAADAEKQAQAEKQAEAERKTRPAAKDDEDAAEPAKKTQAQKRREAEQRQREEEEAKAREERRRRNSERKPAADDDDAPAKKKK